MNNILYHLDTWGYFWQILNCNGENIVPISFSCSGQNRYAQDIPTKATDIGLGQSFLENAIENRDFDNIDIEVLIQKNNIHSHKFAVEITFEKVRNASYPALPSRFACLYLTTQKNSIELWQPQVSSPYGLCEFEVCQKEAYHHADAEWYHRCTADKKDSWETYAHSYWKGETTQEPLLEMLFCGMLKILNYKNIP